MENLIALLQQENQDDLTIIRLCTEARHTLKKDIDDRKHKIKGIKTLGSYDIEAVERDVQKKHREALLNTDLGTKNIIEYLREVKKTMSAQDQVQQLKDTQASQIARLQDEIKDLEKMLKVFEVSTEGTATEE